MNARIVGGVVDEDVKRSMSVQPLHEGLIGFVTDESPSGLAEPGDEPRVAVYLPLSYQIGGFTMLLPRSRLTARDIGVEEAMRLVLTAGIQRRKPETN